MSPQDDEPAGPASPVRRWAVGRRAVRGRAAAVVVALVLGGAGAATLVVRDATAPHPPTSSTRPPPSTGTASAQADTTPDAAEQRLEALDAVLHARSAAVLKHDRAAWLATVDPRATAFRARQGTVFANLRDVPFASWSYDFAGPAPALSPDRLRELGATADTAWVAKVQAGYRLEGFDTSTSLSEQYLTLVRRDGRWLVAADTDGGSAPQPWDLGRVRVAHGNHVLALGTAPAATLRTYAAAGDRAVARVSAVWGDSWSRRVVLVVPRTQHEMGRLLLRPDDGLDQVAAVTTGELGNGDTGRAGSDRVVVNPSAFAHLSATGRRVVLTHELTHVAVRSSTGHPVPIWLSEGFADYVGYQGVDLPRRTVAADVLALVRKGKGPKTLPGTDDFDPTRTTIAPSYSAAWLACALIADRYGQDALVRLYRTVATTQGSADDPPDPQAVTARAFQHVLGTSVAAFTTTWRAYLASLARS